MCIMLYYQRRWVDEAGAREHVRKPDIWRLEESIEYKLLSGEVVIELFQQFYKNILYSYVMFIDIADLWLIRP